MLDILTFWCKKWQLTPQALKYDVVVLENTCVHESDSCFRGNDLTSGRWVGLPWTLTYTQGRLVATCGGADEKWDGVAVDMLGKTGGPPVNVVADVREATVEAGILYGAEFTGGTCTKLLAAVSARQIEVAEEILGLRPSTESAGVMTENGRTDFETKATKPRLPVSDAAMSGSKAV